MLKLLDVLFFWFHIIIIAFNLFGWIWERTRKLHLLVVAGTLFSWLILGFKFGFGYCFLTDWHWNIKTQLGEYNLPASFIKYFLDTYTKINLSAGVVDVVTGLLFGLAILITIYINYLNPQSNKKRA